MTTIFLRWMLCISLGVLLCSLVAAAPPQALSDGQLDQVYAAGFNVTIDMDIDLSATNPDAVFVTGEGAAALQQLMNGGLSFSTNAGGSRNTSSFDPNGTYMPNLQNLTVNNINISDQALQNSNTMMNIFALQGDVAVGMNLNIIVNPTNTALNIIQTNINWGMINQLSDNF